MSPSQEQSKTSESFRSGIEKEFHEEIAKAHNLAMDFLADLLKDPEDKQVDLLRRVITHSCDKVSHKHSGAILLRASLIRAIHGTAWKDAVNQAADELEKQVSENFVEVLDKISPLLDIVEGVEILRSRFGRP